MLDNFTHIRRATGNKEATETDTLPTQADAVLIGYPQASGNHTISVLGAATLLAGGTVGAGIIALPVQTYGAGFLPSLAGLCFCWVILYLSGILLLELCIWFGEESNISSMANATLGKAAKFSCAGGYIFVTGATLVAYIAEAPSFMSPVLQMSTGLTIPPWAMAAVFTLSLGTVVYLGARYIDRCNFWCMMGCILAYLALVLLACKNVNSASLLASDWSTSHSNLNIMITALAFQGLIPSLPKIMNSIEEVRQAILWGSLLPLGMYILWEAAILGSLQPGSKIGQVSDVINGLEVAGGPSVVLAFGLFSFFAIVTSFLSLSLGCLDFLQDLSKFSLVAFVGTVNLPPHITIEGIDRLILLLSFIVPSYLIGVSFPTAFLPALEFSGLLRLILYSVMPALMVWSGRFYQARKPQSWGGRGLLLFVLATSVGMLMVGGE